MPYSHSEFSRGPLSSELSINPEIIDALRGSISYPTETISHKPGLDFGKTVQVRLATEGPGMFGLTDMRDNREWSGIINHTLTTGLYAVHFAEELIRAGYAVDRQAILDGMIVSHAGRRQWDEAGWYPEGVSQLVGENEQKRRRGLSNETLGMQLIQGKVPDNAFKLVVALGHNVEGFSVDPAIYKSLDFLLTIYADHRTTQKYEPLNTRMGDLLLGNFFSTDQITPKKKMEVYTEFGKLIERQKAHHLGRPGVEEVSLDAAEQLAERLGASLTSVRVTSRREFMRLLLQDADTEALLIQSGIDPNKVDDTEVPMPRWEHEFRLSYVEAAKEDIAARMIQLLTAHDESTFIQEFPLTTWWGKYARKIAGLNLSF